MKSLPILFLLTCFLSCHLPDDERLLEVEKILPSSSVYADSVLNSIDDYRKFTPSDRALYGLLRTYADNRLGKDITSDSLIRPAYDYFHDASGGRDTSDSLLLRRYGQSCYYMGLYLTSRDSLKRSEDMFRFAAGLSERCHDWHTCYLAYILLSNSLRLSNPDSALKACLESYSIYNKVKDDPANESLILGKIGGCHAVRGDYDKAVMYYQRALLSAEQNRQTKVIEQIYICLASVYRGKKDYETSLRYALKGSSLSDSVSARSLLTLAECYMVNDSLNRAATVLRSVKCDSDDYMGRYLVMRRLAEVEMKKKGMDSLSVFYDSAFYSLENMYFQSQKTKDEYYNDNIQKEIQKEMALREKERGTWILLFVILLSMVMVTVLLVWLRLRSVLERRKRYLSIVNERHKKTVLLYDRIAQDLRIAEQHNEILRQRKLLEQKMVSMNLLRKYLLERLDGVSTLMKGGERVRITDEVWPEMENYLNMTDDDIMSRIRSEHPDFREDDIRLCMLVRLRIENEMIGKLYNITTSAVKKRKSVLKKNGFHVADPDIDLNQIICGM